MPDGMELVPSIAALDADAWNALAGAQPFVRHEFLAALEATGCASRRSGWQPCHLALRDGGRLAGAVPLYLKTHSRGEYVFDFAWADAFERHGLAYYPKLVAAVPFTPVAGPRLLAADAAARAALAHGLAGLPAQLDVSSLHVLFPDDASRDALRDAGFMLREGVQFHWRNAGYADFDAFLAALSHDKRKKIRQERRRVRDAGITFERRGGADVDDALLAFFFRCYEETYRLHGASPYLTFDFFRRLRDALPDALLLVVARRAGVPLAAALDVRSGDTLYGRYWGTLEFVSGLHFETCYLQAIEHCIEAGLAVFEGGAQGVHKIARGLLPTPTWSAHRIADGRFAAAIGAFLERETAGIAEYLDELETHSPFRAPAGAADG